MFRYKLLLAYDGTDYAGWIQQKEQPSIVQTLQDSFQQAFKMPVKLLGASKTDAGVHAMGQVAIADTDLAIDPEKLQRVWQNALPDSLLIRKVERAADFHPHKNVALKTYYYYFATERPTPFNVRYTTYVSKKVDLEQLKTALKLFEGSHNFAAFYTGNDRQDTDRTIQSINFSFIPERNAYRIKVVGQKFLRHMIRRIVGASLAIATRESLDIKAITTALETGTMNAELPTAPARGLLLQEIAYQTK